VVLGPRPDGPPDREPVDSGNQMPMNGTSVSPLPTQASFASESGVTGHQGQLRDDGDGARQPAVMSPVAGVPSASP
jgi:hypothetical protein